MVNQSGLENRRQGTSAPLIGQQQAITLLNQGILNRRIAPAYLFTGISGIGRGLATKWFSEQLLCLDIAPQQHPSIQKRLQGSNHPDFLWVEPTYLHQGQRLTAQEAEEKGLKRKAPPQIRIEQIREISRFLSRPPLEASRAVVVIEDAHRMAESAANALLKTLEEPGRATLILLAPSVDSLLSTLVSRCQTIPFYPLSLEDMEQVLRQTCHEDILGEPAILGVAQGSPGAAILAWERLQQIPEPLLKKLIHPFNDPLTAFALGKEITKTLELETQLWLVDYLQYLHWQRDQNPDTLEQFEQARKSLLNYVQPRLVWDVTLLHLTTFSQSPGR